MNKFLSRWKNKIAEKKIYMGVNIVQDKIEHNIPDVKKKGDIRTKEGRQQPFTKSQYIPLVIRGGFIFIYTKIITSRNRL